MIEPLAILHDDKGQPYHRMDSLQGIFLTRLAGANAADFNVQVTEDGHWVVTHWPCPMIHDGFYDPKAELPRRTRVDQMTLAEVQRLRIHGDEYRNVYGIKTLHEHWLECRRQGITPCYEIKGWTRSALNALWHLTHGEDMILMGLPSKIEALGHAKLLGFQTLLLSRGPVPVLWASRLTYVKGPWRHCRAVQKRGVKRLGLNWMTATRYGAGCHPRNAKRTMRVLRRKNRR